MIAERASGLPDVQIIIGSFHEHYGTTERLAKLYSGLEIPHYPVENTPGIEYIGKTFDTFYDRSGSEEFVYPHVRQQNIFLRLGEMAENPEDIVGVAVDDGYMGRSTAVELMYIIALGGKAFLTEEITRFSDEVPQIYRDFILNNISHYQKISVDELTQDKLQEIRDQEAYKPEITKEEKEMVGGAINDLLAYLEEEFLLRRIPQKPIEIGQADVGGHYQISTHMTTLIASESSAKTAPAEVEQATVFPEEERFVTHLLSTGTNSGVEDNPSQLTTVEGVVNREIDLQNQIRMKDSKVMLEFMTLLIEQGEISEAIRLAVESGVFFAFEDDKSMFVYTIPESFTQDMVDTSERVIHFPQETAIYRINPNTGERLAVPLEGTPLSQESLAISIEDNDAISLDRAVSFFVDQATDMTFIVVSIGVQFPRKAVYKALKELEGKERVSKIMKNDLIEKGELNPEGYYFQEIEHEGRPVRAILKFDEQNPQVYINPDFSRETQLRMTYAEGYRLVKQARMEKMKQNLSQEGVIFLPQERLETVPAINIYTVEEIAKQLNITDYKDQMRFEDLLIDIRDYLNGSIVKDQFDEFKTSWISSHLSSPDGAFFNLVYTAHNQANTDTIQTTIGSIRHLSIILEETGVQTDLVKSIIEQIAPFEEKLLKEKKEFNNRSDNHKKELVQEFEQIIITILRMLPQVATEDIYIT